MGEGVCGIGVFSGRTVFKEYAAARFLSEKGAWLYAVYLKKKEQSVFPASVFHKNVDIFTAVRYNRKK